MTLFELMLVLVLLVVITSLAAPLFTNSFSSVRLRRGTDQVVASWTEARTHAIEAGKIFQFRFKPEGDAYQVEPWNEGSEVDAEDVKDQLSTSDLTKEEIEFATWRYEATLPPDIVFNEAQSITSDGLGQRSATRLDEKNKSEWSAPILFFPDGSTSEASLLIKNNNGVYRRATLRALTGVARASDALSQTEVDNLKKR